MAIPLVAGLGTPELLIIMAILMLLFGASKLPDFARNSGRALRIFKVETRGLMSDDVETGEQLEIERRHESEPPNSAG